MQNDKPKPDCHTCSGKGEVNTIMYTTIATIVRVQCPRCGGTGKER